MVGCAVAHRRGRAPILVAVRVRASSFARNACRCCATTLDCDSELLFRLQQFVRDVERGQSRRCDRRSACACCRALRASCRRDSSAAASRPGRSSGVQPIRNSRSRMLTVTGVASLTRCSPASAGARSSPRRANAPARFSPADWRVRPTAVPGSTRRLRFSSVKRWHSSSRRSSCPPISRSSVSMSFPWDMVETIGGCRQAVNARCRKSVRSGELAV